LIASPSIAAKIMAVHDPIYISVPWLQHSIAEFLIHHYDDFVQHVKELGELMQDNWKILSVALHDSLGWIPIEPDGSMYGMFYHNAKSDKEAVVQGLRKGVGVAPGRIFYPGLPENTGYVRIHVGISHEKAKMIAKLLQDNKQ